MKIGKSELDINNEDFCYNKNGLNAHLFFEGENIIRDRDNRIV